MLRLLSLTLTNIGPFRDQTRTIDFRSGSFLVKAPIGSGKSFLYFDGPTFALYNKKSRQMLNMHCDKGQIICSFAINDEQYTIQRDLTKTKTGESIKSKLSSSSATLPLGSSATLIDFKNESDLQQTLNSLLPPIEVFLGTQMLMQDSINIFELGPKDRLEILKNVFGLLGIDDAKERINERKREISAMIKARADTSQYDEKIKLIIGKLIDQRGDSERIASHYKQELTNSSRSTTLQERSLLHDKLTIDNLSLPTSPDFQPLLNAIDLSAHEIITLQTQQQGLQQQLHTIAREEQLLKSKQAETLSATEMCKKKLADHDPRLLEEVNKQIVDVQEQINTLDTSLSQDTVSKSIKTLKASGNALFVDILGEATQLYLDNDKQRSIRIVQAIITKLIAIGKDCKYRTDLAQQAQEHSKHNVAQLMDQLTQANQRIASFQNDIDQQKIFECDKIKGPCPYIDLINTATFRKLNEQLQSFITERDQLQQKITAQQSPTTNPQEEEISTLRQASELTATCLKDLGRKKIESQAIQLQALQQSLSKLQQQWQTLHAQSQQIQSLQEQITTLTVTLQQGEQQLTTITEQKTALEEQNTTLREKINTLPQSQQIKQDRDLITQYQGQIERLSQIIGDFKAAQLEVKQLKEDEKVLADLYQIFAKELLLIVVQKNLPLLQDLMNSYLAQVVDYQLQMEIDKKSATNDNIELFVTVLDERGPREVKSLSGGQKVILKIVWMMAVSSLMRTQMLFLDETINNLDGDTVGKVAELLKNFVEGRGKEFMLYVVTHSHQIQEMSIWDKVVELG